MSGDRLLRKLFGMPAGRGVIEIFGDTGQMNAALSQADLDRDVILGVSGKAVDLVDYDNIDCLVTKLIDHPLKLGPLPGRAGHLFPVNLLAARLL